MDGNAINALWALGLPLIGGVVLLFAAMHPERFKRSK